MTVRELVQELARLDGNMPVVTVLRINNENHDQEFTQSNFYVNPVTHKLEIYG